MTIIRTYLTTAFAALALLAMPVHSMAQNAESGVPMLSGGVGDDEEDAIKSEKNQYNVHILFTENNGAFLSDVSVSITKGKGEEIANTVTQGPILYMKLKPGSYTVNASVSGLSRTQKFKVGAGGKTSVHVTFPLHDAVDK